MKRIFLLALLTLLAGVLLIRLVEYDPGYLLISYGHYTIESSLWVALLGFMVLLVTLFVGGFIVRRLIGRSSAARRWLSSRRMRSSQRLTTQGLIDFIEGNFKRARKRLVQGAEKSETPLVNYLMAARASDELGDSKAVKQFLQQAEVSTSGAGTAIELTHAEMELKKGHYEQSLATLMRARRNAARHPYVLRLLLETYKGLGDWKQVLELLPDLKKYNVVDAEKLQELERHAWASTLQQLPVDVTTAAADIESFWQRLPRAIARDPGLAVACAQRLVDAGDEQRAEALLRKQLNVEWHAALVELYGRVDGGESNKQLIHAEQWLRDRNSDPVLFRALGRIALRNELWGKAREYFEISLRLERNGETCAELGRLCASLGETAKSNEYFQQGLLLSTGRLPELPMPQSLSAVSY